jgi:hypothetical protein
MLLFSATQSSSAIQPVIADYPLSGPIALVALGTFLYLIIDIYLSTHSFMGIFGCLAFWLLYAVFCVFGLISFGAIQVAAGPKIIAFVGQTQIAGLLHAVLAVAGSLTVFQSFTLKLSDFKVMDLGQFVDQFRNQVKSAVSQRAAKIQRASNLLKIEKLAEAYRTKAEALLGPLTTALSNVGLDSSNVTNEVEEIRKYCENNKIELSRGFAQKIVVVDADYAETLMN